MTKKRSRKPASESEAPRRDGSLCATFVNTRSAKRGSLESYADLLVWGQQCAVLTPAEAQRLQRAADGSPEQGERIVRQAVALRALLGRVLEALIDQRAADGGDLEALNTAIGESLANRRCVPAEGGYRWGWGDRGGDDLDRMLWPVLLAAAELLTSKYHRLVRRCAAADCDLVFVDRTAGSPKKWCDMATCGHRVNANRHYQRQVKPQRERFKKEARQRRLT